MPLAMDGMDNLFMERYSCWPERFFVLHQGRVAYVAHWHKHTAFRPNEMEAWIKMYKYVTALRQVRLAPGPTALEGHGPPPESYGEEVSKASLSKACEGDLELYRRIAAALSTDSRG